jgi:hypothetical protein
MALMPRQLHQSDRDRRQQHREGISHQQFQRDGIDLTTAGGGTIRPITLAPTPWARQHWAMAAKAC